MQERKPQQSDFMMETIKKRPINKKKLLRRTLTTAVMAVIFGLIACVTFLILEPVFSNWIYPQKEEILYVEFPEDPEEMLPEDMVVEKTDPEIPDLQQEVENVLEEGGQIEAALSSWILNKDNYRQLYAAMSEYKEELKKSLVVITGTMSGTDAFQNPLYNFKDVTGVILAENGVELLILADRSPFLKADSLTVTFYNGIQAAASLKQYDTQTGLAVFAVSLDNIPEQTKDKIEMAALGSSNTGNMVGTPVVAIGSPMGVSNSVGYGIVTASENPWSVVDASYNLLFTDIYGSKNASGVLFNYENKVIGILTNGRNETGMENMITAIGISELKKSITRMSNGTPEIYMGIIGKDMTEGIRKQTGIPLGVYVTDVIMDSPAMLAGLQKGDVLVKMNAANISDMSGYTLALLQCAPGDAVTVVVKRLVQNEYKEIEVSVVLSEKILK